MVTQSEAAWWARYNAAESDFERALLVSLPNLSEEDLRKLRNRAWILLAAGIPADGYSCARALQDPPPSAYPAGD